MSRFLSLAEAAELIVQDGDAVAMAGFTHQIPRAAGHEVIRQIRRQLRLIRLPPPDQSVGMDCAETMVFSRRGNPGAGLPHRGRAAVENGWSAPGAPKLATLRALQVSTARAHGAAA